MEKTKLAIVGATGLVGKMMTTVLEEKNLPIDEYTFFSSKKSAGKIINFKGEQYTVKELKESSFDNNFTFALFSAGSEISKKFAPIARSHKTIVIDNSSFYRMNETVPLIVPEVNIEDLKNHKGIIANPNCSTIQAVVALKPIDTKYNIKRIVYSTYQAVSGAGIKGIHDLENGIKKYYTSQPYNLEKFSKPIFNNCLPHIDDFLPNGYTKEEEKMINETRKILKKQDLKITATTVRVPIFNSHAESINIELEKNFNLHDIIDTLKKSPGIIIRDDPENNIYPLSTIASNYDDVFIGRIRRDFSIASGLNIWVVADNIRKGAASNAVQILENLL